MAEAYWAEALLVSVQANAALAAVLLAAVLRAVVLRAAVLRAAAVAPLLLEVVG